MRNVVSQAIAGVSLGLALICAAANRFACARLRQLKPAFSCGARCPRFRAALLPIFAILLSACQEEALIQTGSVLDSVTRQPIAGAFVLSTYRGCPAPKGFSLDRVVMGHVGSNHCRCENSVGMYTGPDGKFSFPVKDAAGRRVGFPTAIKADFRYVNSEITNSSAQTTDPKKYWRDQNILLATQDPAAPELNFQSHDANCTGAENRQQAAAGQLFLRLELAEYEKYAVSARDFQWESILQLNGLPDGPAGSTVFNSPEAERKIREEDAEFDVRHREAKQFNSGLAERYALSISRTQGHSDNKSMSCIGFRDARHTSELQERVGALRIKTQAGPGDSISPCVSLADEEEVIKLAHMLIAKYRALETMRVKRYPTQPTDPVAHARLLEFSAAIAGNDVGKVRALIKAGANPNEFIQTNIDGHFSERPLLVAVMLGYADLTGLLVNSGAEVDAMDRGGQTALHFLARRRLEWDAYSRDKLTKALMNGGASPNVVFMATESPLMLAAERGDVELVKLLIARGANPNYQGGSSMNPLYAAVRFLEQERDLVVRKRYLEIAEQLVLAGAQVPLHLQTQDADFKKHLQRLESAHKANEVVK